MLLLFTCMSTRAVHIEVIPTLDTSGCINAIRRFFAIRGPAKHLRLDCGTNFVGAWNELGFLKKMEGESVQRYLNEHGCAWEFNSPHSSHMGGAWERMIGIARRILDGMLAKEHAHLTHDVLCTLMAEVSAIINSKPLIPVSTDPESPYLLTPATLLTQKTAAASLCGGFTDKDLFGSQWKRVHVLANNFWNRWRSEYLSSLQQRCKWNKQHRNLQKGDIVLLKDSQAARNEWPMAVVVASYPSADGLVCKVELKVTSHGTSKTFLRPISEVLLMPKETER